MNIQRERLGSHCPAAAGSNGSPLLQLPPTWQGLHLAETITPGDAECGPQYTGIPILTMALSGNIKRWYRCGLKTHIFENGAPEFDVFNSDYERDYGCWKGEAGRSIRISITPSVIERYLPDQAASFDLETRYEQRDETFRNLVLALANELKTGLYNGETYAEGLSLSILGWLNKHYAVKKNITKQPKKLSARHQACLCEFINASLESNLTIEKMAAELGVSPSHFSPLFRNAFGMPPHQYVMKKRVEKAALLIRSEPDRSIKDIACSTGFSSQSDLTDAFKRHMKQTPACWKKNK